MTRYRSFLRNLQKPILQGLENYGETLQSCLGESIRLRARALLFEQPPAFHEGYGSKQTMWLRDLFGMCLLLSFLLLIGNLAGDPGVGWHLRAGEWIVVHGKLPLTDPFLAGKSDTPWVHDQWLSDLIFWKLYSFGGIGVLQAFVVGLAIYSYVGILGNEMAGKKSFGVLSFATLALLAPLGSLQWFIRPVIFSFILFVSVYVLCRNALTLGSLSGRAILFLALIFALWANLHPGFPLGLLLLGVTAVSFLLRRDKRNFMRTIVAGGLCLLTTAANPYGLALHSSILKLLGNSFFMQLNAEWMSPDFSEVFFLPFLVVLFLLALFALRGSLPKSAFDIIALLGFGVLALFERRTIPYFAVVAAAPLSTLLTASAENFNERRKRLFSFVFLIKDRRAVFMPGSLVVWAALTVLLAGRSEALGTFPPAVPVELGKRLTAENSGKVFHSPDLGGLLIWFQGEGVKASIDDRNQVSSQEDYERYFTAALAREGWREVLRPYSFAVVSNGDPLRHVIAEDGWVKVGEYSSWLLFQRTK